MRMLGRPAKQIGCSISGSRSPIEGYCRGYRPVGDCSSLHYQRADMEATKEQRDAARKNAMRAEMLRAQARRFMKFVGECLAHEGFLARAAVEGAALPGDERESFELSTSFGR